MNKEELNRIIEELESANSEEEAYFNVEENHNYHNGRYVNANKAGLQLMAAQFLIASVEFDDFVNQEDRDEDTLWFSKTWSTGSAFINYIDPVLKEEDKKVFPEYNPGLFQKIFGSFILFTILLLIVGLFITGIVTVIGWFI